MPLYEHTVIARQDLSTQQAQALAETFGELVTTNGGEVKKVEHWGLRNLSYRINKNRKGHYIHMNLDAPSSAVDELERNQRLHEDVLRYLTVRVDDHTEEPSAMLQVRSGRDDRGGRRGDRDRGDRGGRDRDRGPRGDRGERSERPERSERTERSEPAENSGGDTA